MKFFIPYVLLFKHISVCLLTCHNTICLLRATPTALYPNLLFLFFWQIVKKLHPTVCYSGFLNFSNLSYPL
uniref:Uncharacterized protein n=1 Tax=Oryza brachyantha TaxID=4533 RepID=J3LRW2_ORYBR